MCTSPPAITRTRGARCRPCGFDVPAGAAQHFVPRRREAGEVRHVAAGDEADAGVRGRSSSSRIQPATMSSITAIAGDSTYRPRSDPRRWQSSRRPPSPARRRRSRIRSSAARRWRRCRDRHARRALQHGQRIRRACGNGPPSASINDVLVAVPPTWRGDIVEISRRNRVRRLKHLSMRQLRPRMAIRVRSRNSPSTVASRDLSPIIPRPGRIS